MPLPESILRSAHRFGPRAMAAALDATAGAALDYIYTVPLVFQEARNWCWAALAHGLAVRAGRTAATSQCQFVGGYLNRPCCPAVPNGICDVVTTMADVLGQHGWPCLLFGGPHNTRGAVDESQLADLLDNNNGPVVAEISWGNNTSHVVLIVGRRAGDRTFYVADPLDGPAGTPVVHGFTRVLGWGQIAAYRGTASDGSIRVGTWTDTFHPTG